MFEIIGLLIDAVVFFGLSVALGACFALATWLLLRRRRLKWVMVLVAGAVPPLCAVYMAACMVLFPGFSLFGDIDEPLPHGYTLKALGKMPDFGRIEKSSGELSSAPDDWIGEVDLEGEILYGKYSHGSGGYDDKPKWCCFAFNTATSEVRNFTTPDELNSFAGKTIVTEEVQYFQSREPAHVRMLRIEDWILFTPPTTAVLLLLALLLWWRMSTSFYQI